MSMRIQRAKPLRRRLAEPNGSREKSVEMSATLTIACVFLLLSIGASMVTSYVMIYNPDCMGNTSLQSSTTTNAPMDRPTTVPAVDSKTKPAAVTVAATPPPPPPPPPTPAPVETQPPLPSLVPECSADQMTQLSKQLPNDGCDKPAWNQACSFTIATAKSGCPDSTVYYRQPMASLSLQDPFRGVIIGTKDDEIIIDLLQLGTHDATKYDLQKWGGIVGSTSCQPPAVTYSGTPQTAKILVIEPDTTKAMKVKRWKTEMGLSNEELRGETTRITNTPPGVAAKTLNTWTATEIPTGPIHFLRLDSEADYEVLLSGAGPGGALERVWYLEFQYHWQGQWPQQQLKDLIHNTLRDFACYWRGGKGNLWRISGCWQGHYAKHSWSYLVCVNVRIEAAKPIADKMEEVFLATLAKDQTFHE